MLGKLNFLFHPTLPRILVEEAVMSMEEKIIEYIAFKSKGISPFRMSRILLLLKWAFKEKGTDIAFTFETLPYGFSVKEIPEIVEKDPCLSKEKITLEKGRVTGVIKYVCIDPPKLDLSVKTLIDKVLEETSKLDDFELNRVVIKDKRYSEMLKTK